MFNLRIMRILFYSEINKIFLQNPAQQCFGHLIILVHEFLVCVFLLIISKDLMVLFIMCVFLTSSTVSRPTLGSMPVASFCSMLWMVTEEENSIEIIRCQVDPDKGPMGREEAPIICMHGLDLELQDLQPKLVGHNQVLRNL